MIREYRTDDLDDLLAAGEKVSAVVHPFSSPEFPASERRNVVQVYPPSTDRAARYMTPLGFDGEPGARSRGETV